MNMLKKTVIAASLAAVGVVGQAQAQSMSDTFQVSITVEGTCEVLTVSDIDFGLATHGDVDQTGDILVRCSNGLPYTLELSGGQSLDINNRRMGRPNDARGTGILYQLSAAAGGTVWGTLASGTAESGVGTGLSNDVAHTVYASTTLTGNELIGSYVDTITATLTF